MQQRQVRVDPALWPGRQSPKVADFGHAEQQANDRSASQHDQHAAKRCRENLLRLRTERDTNTQLAQPLADRIGGEAEGAGDREQESKSTKNTEGHGGYLDWKESQCKLVVPGA